MRGSLLCALCALGAAVPAPIKDTVLTITPPSADRAHDHADGPTHGGATGANATDAEAPPEPEEEKRECVDDAEARLDGDPDFAAQMSSAVSDAMGSVMQPQMDFSPQMPLLVNRRGAKDGETPASDGVADGIASMLLCSSPDLDRAFCRSREAPSDSDDAARA